MNEEKLMRVVGLSSASLLDKENPFNPTNRRISLIIMNKQAEEDAIRDEAGVQVESDASKEEIGAAVALPSH